MLRRSGSRNSLHHLWAALIARTGEDAEVAIREHYAQGAATGALEMAYMLGVKAEPSLGCGEALAAQDHQGLCLTR